MKNIIVTTVVLIFALYSFCYGEILVKQNENNVIIVGALLNKDDGLTELTGEGTPTAVLMFSDGTTDTLEIGGSGGFRQWAHLSDGHYQTQIYATETTVLGDARVVYSDPATYIQVVEFIRIVGTDTYNRLVGGETYENSKSYDSFFKVNTAVLQGKSDDSSAGTIIYNNNADNAARATFTITSGERSDAVIDGKDY